MRSLKFTSGPQSKTVLLVDTSDGLTESPPNRRDRDVVVRLVVTVVEEDLEARASSQSEDELDQRLTTVVNERRASLSSLS